MTAAEHFVESMLPYADTWYRLGLALYYASIGMLQRGDVNAIAVRSGGCVLTYTRSFVAGAMRPPPEGPVTIAFWEEIR